jgi:hypothetical protein
VLSDKVPGRGTHIPPQAKPPASPRRWKTICAVIGAVIGAIAATNEELQRWIGLPPGLELLAGLAGGGLLGTAVGRAIDKRGDRKN